MQRLLISIKRFFKNKNTVTVIGLVASLAIIYFAYNSQIQKAIEPVRVPYALVNIAPGTLITDDMVGMKEVPGGIVVKGKEKDPEKQPVMLKSQIVGKYVTNTAVIPQNSIFYGGMIVEWEKLPTSLYHDIPVDNALVALEVDMETTYGNSIYPGNYIDLYYVGQMDVNADGEKLTNNQTKLSVGKFIESIKVLSVVASDGTSVFEKIGSPKQPSYLIFSVPEDYHLLLRKADYLGEQIFPVPRNAEYSKNPKETAIVNATIKNYIEEKTQDVDDKIFDAKDEIKIEGDKVDAIGGNPQ